MLFHRHEYSHSFLSFHRIILLTFQPVLYKITTIFSSIASLNDIELISVSYSLFNRFNRKFIIIPYDNWIT